MNYNLLKHALFFKKNGILGHLMKNFLLVIYTENKSSSDYV